MIRPARMSDVPALHRLITYHAERGSMLFRSFEDLYENLRDFLVCEADGQVVGCCAVELVWRDLAELKSLAVDPPYQGRGMGNALVVEAIRSARELELRRLFALTRHQAFFERLGFAVVPKESLPHKVWSDCFRCPVRAECDETAMVIQLDASASP